MTWFGEVGYPVARQRVSLAVTTKGQVVNVRILDKFGYPLDPQEAAVKTVLKQAELLCAGVGDGVEGFVITGVVQ